MCSKRPCVLIIEDDANLVLIISNFLKSLHFDVLYAYNGKDAIEEVLKNKYQLAIIDLGLPDMSGFQVVEKIREINNKPIIIITGSKEENDEIKAFKSHVNLYHYKPLNYEILEAQIKSLINPNLKGNIIKTLDIYIDTSRRIIKNKNKVLDLTKTETDFLIMLAESKGEIFTRKQIISNVLNNFNDPSIYCVDTMVSRIRKKFKSPLEKSLIKTVNGIGYTINPIYFENIRREYS